MATRRRTFLAEWREYRQLTQPQAAAQAGMTAGNLSFLETGRQNYTQKTLEALAEVYQCRPADLLLFNPLKDPGGIDEAWDRVHSEFARKQA